VRVRLLILLAVSAAVIAACGGDDDPSTPTPEATANPDAEAIPQEPIPDILPEPYIFRGDELFGGEVEEKVQEQIYVVQPGDTLALIAEAAGVSTEELQRLNGIADPSVLAAGDELRLPIRGGDRIAATTAGEQEDFSSQPPGDPYTVQPGDTLIDIALARGLDWTALQSYNGLTDFEAGHLLVGQVLIIPPPEALEEEEAEPPG
jgi:LysM repeat protein